MEYAQRRFARLLGAAALVFSLGAFAAEPAAEQATDPAADNLTETPTVVGDASAAAALELAITGLRNSDGQMLISVFQGEEGFPNDREKAVVATTAPIKDGEVLATIDELPAGEYGVSVCHDENNNGECDSNFFGMPTEGIGMTNNVKPSFGPPKYDDAKITLEDQPLSFTIEMIYI